MTLSIPRARLVSVVLTALATAFTLAAPAHAGNKVTPGNFTGYGFDQCVAPSQEAMDRWLTSSPFFAIGIYISGASRGCRTQTNLTPGWVSTQLAHGWRLLPITLGPQASCSTRFPRYGNDPVIDHRPANNYAAARKQGRLEAHDAVGSARRLGISAGSTLWYDLEAYDIRGNDCRESALSFLSAWTNKLHGLGYVSGVYSSAATGMKALDDARATRPGKYAMPDQIWVADWNGKADVYSTWIRDSGWMPHKRVHQYRGDHNETHGGVTINIDSNWLDVGKGSVAPKARPSCGVKLDFADYKSLKVGMQHRQVLAAQCMLSKKKFYDRPLSDSYDKATNRAVRQYQSARGLPVGGGLNLRTWTALFAQGRQPVTKVGSATLAVRRLQRTLNAATDSRLKVTGVFGSSTTSAVHSYQGAVGLPRTGVVAKATWQRMAKGRR